MRNRLHVLDVVRQAEELAEAEQAENFQRPLLFGDKFRFQFFEPEVARDLHHFADQNARQALPAKILVDQDADPSEVPFPAAQLLMQRRFGQDLALLQSEQRQIPPQIDVLAPAVNDLAVGHPMLDEHPLGHGHRQEKLMQVFLIRALERPHLAMQP